ncbi:MAG: hypothetical protein AAF266_15990 [Planctomycetota bacterium]
MNRVLIASLLLLPGLASAAQFVPLGIGTWETYGQWNPSFEVRLEAIVPAGSSIGDVPFARPLPGGGYQFPDGSPVLPPTTWPGGFQRVLISDDGSKIAGYTDLSQRPIVQRIGPTGELEGPLQFTPRPFGGDPTLLTAIDMAADGSVYALSAFGGAVSRNVWFNRSEFLTLPPRGFGLDETLPPELDDWRDNGQRGLRAISGDGSVLVGTAFERLGFRWDDREGRFQVLEGMSSATDTSFDGSVVIGGPHRWTVDGGTELLGPEPTDEFTYEAIGVSADGDKVAGTMIVDGVASAFIWTAEGGIQPLAELPGTEASNVTAISADGNTVVGQASTAEGVVAFRWNAAAGMQSIESLLLDGGADLAGYSLTSRRGIQGVSGVSADGTVLVGTGKNSMGQEFSWLARAAIIPEPTALPLACMALIALATRRHRFVFYA